MSATFSGKTASQSTRDWQAGLEVDHRDVEGGMHTRPRPEESPMVREKEDVSMWPPSPYTLKEGWKPKFATSSEPEHRQNRIPFGLTPLLFGLLTALVGILVGGGLGGGLATSLSNSKSVATATCPASVATQIPATSTATSASSPTRSLSSPTPQSTTPSASPIPGELVYTLPVNNFTVPPYYNVSAYTSCPNKTPARYTDQYYQSYEFLCDTVYAPGKPADAQYGGVIGDLSSTVAYSLEDCTLMCTLWNADASIPHTKVCRSISWVPDIGAAFSKFGANCVLKNATGPGDPYTQPMIVSAKLVSAI